MVRIPAPENDRLTSPSKWLPQGQEWRPVKGPRWREARRQECDDGNNFQHSGLHWQTRNARTIDRMGPVVNNATRSGHTVGKQA